MKTTESADIVLTKIFSSETLKQTKLIKTKQRKKRYKQKQKSKTKAKQNKQV